jgi:branched-chain amino acid transport system permease protein
MVPDIGTETHTLPVPYKDQGWNAGALVLNVEQMVVIGSTAALSPAAVRDVQVQQARRRDAGVVAEPARGLLHGHSGEAPERPGVGPGAAWRRWPGLLLAPITFVHANMGFIGLKAFPAAVVGGFGSLPGAIVGGLVIGVVESLSASTFRTASRTRPRTSSCC